jgi:integrase
MKGIVNRGSAERPNWYCRYVDIDGKRKNRPTHQATEALAGQFLAAVKARVAQGKPGIAADAVARRPPAALTLRQLVERYLQQAAPRSKDPERYRRVLRWTLGRHVLPELGALPLPLLSAPVLEQLCERRLAQGYKPATVNSIVRNLSVLLTWGRRMELYSGRNPAAGLQRPVPAGAADYFTAAEVARLLAVARQEGPAPHALLATAVYTGMRKGELFGLRWEDVCFAPAQLRVMRSYASTPKSGRWRAIPIHPELLAILTDWQRVRPHPELVFPIAGRMGTSRELGPLPTLLRRANLRTAARPFHALRHTFASHYVMAGGNLMALQKLLGHSRFEMTQIYSHLAPEYLAGEVGRLRFPGK